MENIYIDQVGMKMSVHRRAAFNQLIEYIFHKKIKIEKVKKCFCGENSFEILSNFDRYGLPFGTQACRSCGLITQTYRIQPDSLKLFYQEIYWPLVLGSGKSKNFFTRGKIGENQSYILPHISKELNPITVFEVGCGSGERISKLCLELEAMGKTVNAVGSDYSTEVLEEAHKLGIKTIEGGFDELQIFGKADILILSHLFEHLPDLNVALRDIEKITHENSLIYIEVPGVKDLQNKKEYFYDYQMYNVLAHTYNFSLTSLCNVMSKRGFNCLSGDEFVRSVFIKSPKEYIIKNDFEDVKKSLAIANIKKNILEKKRHSFGKSYLKRIVKSMLNWEL